MKQDGHQKDILVPRWPAGSFAILLAASLLQVFLCRPAATCRGYPPIRPFWTDIAPWLAFLLVFLFPLFDDRLKTRRILRYSFTLVATPALAWTWANLGSLRPHYVDLTIVVFESLFIILPIYGLIFFLEWLSVKVWSLLRDFSIPTKTSQPGPRFQFSLRIMLVSFALVPLIYFGVHRCCNIPLTSAEYAYHSRSNMRSIWTAMQVYQSVHGSLPYHEEGPLKALYLLHDQLDAACFDGSPLKPDAERAYWDDKSHSLCNGDWLYLNPLPGEPYRQRVILCNTHEVTRDFKSGSRPDVFVAVIMFGDFTWYNFKPTPSPLDAYLGNWLTVDEFFVPDRDVFLDWCRTHPFAGVRSQDETSVRYNNGTVITNYFDTNGSPVRSEITTPHYFIHEKIRTDDLGRIIGIERDVKRRDK